MRIGEGPRPLGVLVIVAMPTKDNVAVSSCHAGVFGGTSPVVSEVDVQIPGQEADTAAIDVERPQRDQGRDLNDSLSAIGDRSTSDRCSTQLPGAGPTSTGPVRLG